MLKTLNIKALSISIAFLVLSGCSVLSSSKPTTTEKRAIETREYSVDTKTLIQVSLATFADLGYTIDVIQPEFGLITASKTKPMEVKEPNDFEKGINLFTGIFQFIGLLLGDWDSDAEYYDDVIIPEQTLNATINITEINEDLSSLRANFQGTKKKYSVEFFSQFFIAIDKALFLEE
tara:strand:- start:1851 stop:2381 length:531 start_codon:yes stop_codon:yes gene_type:complete